MATGGNIPVTNLDFFEIKDSLKSFLSNQDQFKDYDFDGSALSTLLDVLSYNTHYMGFYANMVANESFLDSAVTRNAVVSIAKQLGYTPTSTQAARAEVQISYSGATPDFLPAGTIFNATDQSGRSYTFVNPDVVTIGATGGSGDNVAGATASIIEGSLRTISFVYDGSKGTNQKFTIPNRNVDNRYLKVRVQNSTSDSTGFGTPWTKATNYAGLTSGSNSYFLEESTDGLFEVYFGDGIIGNKPNHGNVITVDYHYTNGAIANGIGRNDVETGRRSFTLNPSATVDVTSFAQGGGENESIDSVRYFAPRVYQAQDRAVTTEDYSTLIQTQYADTESVFVYGGEDAIPPQYGKVFVAIKPLSGTKLSDSEKDSVARSVLQEKNIVSIIPEIIDPEYVYLKFKTNVVFDPARTGAGSEGIKTLVKEKLLSFVDRRLEKFGEHLYYSRLLSEIDNLDDSIVGNETSIKMQKWLEPILGFPGGYTINFYNPIFNPHTGHAVASIESTIFKYRDADGIIRDANIEDDGAGKLIIVRKTSGQKIKMFEIGTINYSTGSLELVSFNPVTDDTSSLIKFTATPRDQNIMSSRNIILTIDSADSTTTDVSIEIEGRRTLDTTETTPQVITTTSVASTTRTTPSSAPATSGGQSYTTGGGGGGSDSSGSGNGGGGGGGGGGYGGY